MKLLLEVVGWILTLFGGYFVFDNDPSVIHYIALVAGVVILIYTLPKTFRKRKS